MNRTTQRWHATVLVLCTVGVSNVHAQTSLDLSAALALAAHNSPLLRAAASGIAEAEGQVVAAGRSLQSNPELWVVAGPRVPTDSQRAQSTDYEFELEQAFRTGGQRQYRIGVAESGTGQARAAADEARRLVELAVATRFYEALAAARRTAVASEAEDLAAAFHATAESRLRLGEGTQLELNTASMRLARTRRRVGQAIAGQREAMIRLVEVVGLPLDASPQLVGELPGVVAVDAAAIVDAGTTVRPDVAASVAAVAAAEAGVQLADADAKPDLALRASYGRDDGDHVLMAGVRVELPVFNRDQGERATARARVLRLRAEELGVRRAAEAEVRAALAVYEQAAEALRIYGDELLVIQEDSLRLLQRAFEEGEVGYPEVLVVQEQLIASREEHVDTQLSAALALARLRAAAGLPQVPTATRGVS